MSISGPLKVVIIGPPGSGKTQLAQAIAEIADYHNASSALYDGDNIRPDSKANIVIMTVQCSAEQFDNPAQMLTDYQKRGGKI